MNLEKIEELIKKDEAFYGRIRKILHDKSKTFEEKLQEPAIRDLYKRAVKNEVKFLEKKALDKEMQNTLIKDPQKKLVQSEINKLTIFGTSNRWDSLPDAVKEQVKEQHSELLKAFDLKPLTPTVEKQFKLDDPEAGELIYEGPRAALETPTDIGESLWVDSSPINMPLVLGGVVRIRLFTWQNYIGVALYTDWGNYFGPPTNVLEYIEYLKEKAIEEGIKNENLHENLELKEEVKNELDVKHEQQEKHQPEKQKPVQGKSAGKDEVDNVGEENTASKSPTPNPFKTSLSK